MRIDVAEQTPVTLESIRPGQAFRFNNLYYMKTDETSADYRQDRCVRLSDGHAGFVLRSTPVSPERLKLVRDEEHT